jgi:hypothetical protein
VWIGGRLFSSPRILPSAVSDLLRASDRLAVAMLMGTCVLAGVSFIELTRRLPRRVARPGSLVLAAVVLAGIYASWAQPVPLLGVTRNPLDPYPTIAARPPDGAVEQALARSTGPLLELPIGPAGLAAADAMVRSIYHRHPLLNGYNGYWPQEFPQRMALACRLPDRDALAELVDATGVDLVLVHLISLDGSRHHGAGLSRCPPDPRRDAAPPGSESREWIAVATDGTRSDLRLVAREGDQLLFRVTLDRRAHP